MSGLSRALLLAALLAGVACHYDASWDQGAVAADAASPAPGGRVVVTGGPDLGTLPLPSGKSCDLFARSCPAGEACYRYACAPEGKGAAGAHCNQDSECVSGTLCQTSTATCRAICKDVDKDDCGEWCCSETCVRLGDPRLDPVLGYCLP